MPIIKVSKLIASNFYFIYKILLYYLACILLLAVAFQFIILPAINPIVNRLNEYGIIEQGQQIVKSVVSLNSDDLSASIESFRKGFGQFMTFVQQGGLVALYFAIFGFYILAVYFLAFKDVASCEYLEKQVSAKLKVSFIGLLIKNAKKSLLYTLIVVLISSIFMLMVIPLMFFLAGFLFGALGILSIFFIVLLSAALYSLYFSFFAFCLPQVAEGKHVFRSFGKGIRLSAKHFAKVFPMTFAFFLFVLFINVVIIFFTFGAGTIISFPLTFLSIISFKIVLQHGAYNKPFYVSAREVAQINLEENPLDVKLDNEEEIMESTEDEIDPDDLD